MPLVRVSTAVPPERMPTDQQSSATVPPSVDRRWYVAGAALVALAVPFVVAAVTLRRPHWYPVLDLTMTELRLRDVGTRHTPLIGLPGRIGPSLMEQGSHPGPLSFYLLAPVYRVLGSSSWAMLAGAITLNVGALAASLAIAARRGGTRLVIAVAALLALLCLGYGLTALTQPWNPYLPLLWWVVFLLAVWSVVCGDVVMLPVAVAAGSLCAQTHVPYLGLAVGLGAVAVVAAVREWLRATPGSSERRRVTRWGMAAGAVGVLLWIPPLVDQAANDPGNLRALYNHLATPSGPDEPAGVGRGLELAVHHLDLVGLIGDVRADGTLLQASGDTDGSLVPGVALLVIWIAAALLARRLERPALVRLHLVVGASLVLGVASMSRILGKEWYYLMLWAWATTALLLLAVGWTALAALARFGARPAMPRRPHTAATAGLAGVLAVASVALTVEAVDAEPPEPHLSSPLGAVLPGTIDALERGAGPATGRDGRYTVVFDDALYFGSQAYGLVGELERAGFDAGMPDVYHVPITDHRVIAPEDATALVVLANADNLDRWRAVPEAVEVASVEPTEAAQAEFDHLRDAVIDDLRAEGLDDLVTMVDSNLFAASIDERVSDTAEDLMARMLELGQPTAVFIAPPGASP
ncbi:MAG TPA: hypothetical protein VKD21_16895 [Acidimicrobiales bacterium]|nr:hypothetical protein [Acidimicrobiales bacterium]